MPAVSSPSPPRISRGLVVLSHTVGDAVVVVLRGTLYATARDAIEAPMADALVRGHRHLVLDLHELREVDPYGLWVISSVVARAIRRGATVSAVGARPALAPRIEALDADGLRIHPTVRSAIAAAARPSPARAPHLAPDQRWVR